MFSHIFTKRTESSPVFEVATIPFRLRRTEDFLTLEYLGKSYREAFFHVNLIVGESLVDFGFSYSIFSNAFSVPISSLTHSTEDTKESREDCNKDINRNNREHKHSNRDSRDHNKNELSSGDMEVAVEIVQDTERTLPLMGLENLGATCYINSLLQTIYFLPQLKERLYRSEGYHCYLMQRLFYSLDKMNGSMFSSSRRIDNPADREIGNLLSNNTNNNTTNNTISTDNNTAQQYMPALHDRLHNLIKNLSFVRHMSEHQDVHEFSKFLFESLESEDKRLIERLIQGTVVSIVECEHGCVSRTKQPFQDLQMVIKDFYQGSEGATNRNIRESLEEFCRPCTVDGFECEKHGRVSATKKVLFDRLPPSLFILLNRFSMDWESGQYVKINERYEFPEELDLTPFMDNSSEKRDGDSSERSDPEDKECTRKHHRGSQHEGSNRYRLFSVIVHSGVADQGHFYCYLNIAGRYYKFNDETVNECSKLEAVDWNYGGCYPHRPEKEKHFSAYYLVYCADTSADISNVAQDSTRICFEPEQLVDPSLLARLSAPLEPLTISYLDSADVVGYRGPGRYNTRDFSFPLISLRSMTCYETDSLAKIFPKKITFTSEDFKPFSNRLLVPGTFYLTSNAKNLDLRASINNSNNDSGNNAGRNINASNKKTLARLVFLKLFSPKVWCTFPNCLYSLGEKRVCSMADFESFSVAGDYEIYIENYKFGASNEKVWKITDFEQISNGDSVVMAPKDSLFTEFIDRFHKNHLVNIFLGATATVPMFVERGLRESELRDQICRFFHSREISLVGDTGCSEAYPILPRNRINCAIAEGYTVYYVGVQSTCSDFCSPVSTTMQCGKSTQPMEDLPFDINLIEHVHSFILPVMTTADDLLRSFRLSDFPCMAKLQEEQDLCVVEAHKASTNIRVHSGSDTLDPKMGFLVIQRRIARPIKMSFYRGSYELINYPFLLENPLINSQRTGGTTNSNAVPGELVVLGDDTILEDPQATIKDLRMKYFFSNRIVKYNGSSYVECLGDDSLNSLEAHEILLIEKE